MHVGDGGQGEGARALGGEDAVDGRFGFGDGVVGQAVGLGGLELRHAGLQADDAGFVVGGDEGVAGAGPGVLGDGGLVGDLLVDGDGRIVADARAPDADVGEGGGGIEVGGSEGDLGGAVVVEGDVCAGGEDGAVVGVEPGFVGVEQRDAVIAGIFAERARAQAEDVAAGTGDIAGHVIAGDLHHAAAGIDAAVGDPAEDGAVVGGGDGDLVGIGGGFGQDIGVDIAVRKHIQLTGVSTLFNRIRIFWFKLFFISNL